eukprot:13522688-Ditylum_brightwellii.AAC.1
MLLYVHTGAVIGTWIHATPCYPDKPQDTLEVQNLNWMLLYVHIDDVLSTWTHDETLEIQNLNWILLRAHTDALLGTWIHSIPCFPDKPQAD